MVVVRVHESQDGAHAVDMGTSVYLRADNISEHFTRKASIEEIGWLIDKRRKSITFKEKLIDTARERASNYVVAWRSKFQLSTQEPKGMFTLWTVPRFPRSELVSPRQLLQFSRSPKWTQQVANSEFPATGASPIADGIRQPGRPGRTFWYTEVNRFGLIYTAVGFSTTNQAGAINCQRLAQLLIGGLKFSVDLYENKIGYFGLVDFHFSVQPTLNCYPYFWEGNADADNRCLDNTVRIRFTDTVRNIRDSLMDRAEESYCEFLWAFGMNVDIPFAAGHFKMFNVA